MKQIPIFICLLLSWTVGMAQTDTLLPEKKIEVGGHDDSIPPPMGKRKNIGVQGSPDFLKGMGGISARTILKHPAPKIKKGVTGVIVTDICIDPKGKVISVAYDAVKSSIKDKSVIRKVKRTAKRYKFAPSSSDKPDCGEITFRFASQ